MEIDTPDVDVPVMLPDELFPVKVRPVPDTVPKLLKAGAGAVMFVKLKSWFAEVVPVMSVAFTVIVYDPG